jgi:hypothetical protein
MSETSVENIKKFLIDQLKFTPRRILFEEFDAKLRSRVDQVIKNQEHQNAVTSQNFDFKLLQELKKFRQKNPHDCMSELNLRKFNQKNKEEEVFLQHKCIHRYELNDRLIPQPVKSDKEGNSLCLLCNKLADDKEINKSILVKGVNSKVKESGGNIFVFDVAKEKNSESKLKQIFCDNSLALTQQKMKY